MPSWWIWKHTYSLLLLLLLILCGIYFSVKPLNYSPAVNASVSWGILALILCLIFMLGAAQTSMQFLVFFGTGSFGAGMGYLVGAWLTPSGESNPLDQVRNIVAGVLTGVVGTKLLTLWDDLVDTPTGGGKPRILTSAYFVPLILWLVGFTVSLSAFYTVRSEESGDVRITYTTSPGSNAWVIEPKHLGVLPDATVQFAAAANSPVDVTTKWDFDLNEPCGSQVTEQISEKATPSVTKEEFRTQALSAFDTKTGVLKSPTQIALQGWVRVCPGAQNWVLTAISNQDRSKTSRYSIKFCLTKEECPGKPLSSSPDVPAKGMPGSGTPSGFEPKAVPLDHPAEPAKKPTAANATEKK